MPGGKDKPQDRRWNAAFESLFVELKSVIPEGGIQGLTPEQGLKHLITKHNGDKPAVVDDIARWHDGVLELDVWKTVGRKEEEAKPKAATATSPAAGRGRGAGKGPRPVGRGTSVPAATTGGEATEEAAPAAGRSKSSAGRGAGRPKHVTADADNTAAPAPAPAAAHAHAHAGKAGKQAPAAPKPAWGPAGSLQQALKAKEAEKVSVPPVADKRSGEESAHTSAVPEGRDRLNNVRRHNKKGEGVPPTGGEAPAPAPAAVESAPAHTADTTATPATNATATAATTAAPKKAANSVWGQKSGVSALIDGKPAPAPAPAAAADTAATTTHADASAQETVVAPEPEVAHVEQVEEAPAPAPAPAPVHVPAPVAPVVPAAEPVPAGPKVLLGRYAEVPAETLGFSFGVPATAPAGGDAPVLPAETTSTPLTLNSLGLLGAPAASSLPLHAADLEAQQLAAAAAAHKPADAPAPVPAAQPVEAGAHADAAADGHHAGSRDRARKTEKPKPRERAAQPVAPAPAPVPAPAPAPAAAFPGMPNPALAANSNAAIQQQMNAVLALAALNPSLLAAMYGGVMPGTASAPMFSPYFPMMGASPYGAFPTATPDAGSFPGMPGGFAPGLGGLPHAAPAPAPTGPSGYPGFGAYTDILSGIAHTGGQQAPASSGMPSMSGPGAVSSFGFPGSAFAPELYPGMHSHTGYYPTSSGLPTGSYAAPSLQQSMAPPRTSAPPSFGGYPGFPGGHPTGFEHSAPGMPSAPLPGGFDAAAFGGQAPGLPQQKGPEQSGSGAYNPSFSLQPGFPSMAPGWSGYR